MSIVGTLILGIIATVVAAGATGTYYYYNLEQQTQEKRYQDCRQKFTLLIGDLNSLLERINSIDGSFDIGGELRAQYSGLQNKLIKITKDCKEFTDLLNNEFSSNIQYGQGQMRKFVK